MTVTLQDLPQFTVERIKIVDDVTALLEGNFNTLQGVALKKAEDETIWDYLYRPHQHFAAVVVSVDKDHRKATFDVQGNLVKEWGVSPGTQFAWIAAHWDPSLLDAILDSQTSWSALRPDSHRERCDLCLGRKSDYSKASGANEVSVCNECFERYVNPRDLSFITE